jgi:hypothetical protein
MTDDLIARLRSWRLPAADKAADALEAQARRIAELETEVGKHVMRVFALMDLLPDATLCGELQEATARRHEMPARIAALEALLSQTNEGYAECIAEREDWREKAKQAEIDIDAADEWAKGFIEKTDARIAELTAALREAYEVYAGSDGFIPETAAEGYQQQLIKQMVGIIGAALEKK